ncbi:precorrin-2 dehydrogenase/sirohydrochlorin ferrochelatase family protein [Brevibacillus dissolubilis]|uniref:precorrin-2 dehydrogenase/sirohydrochlorin ferrochelatase family protein n=1 Tax=Brevibacillus dissolubilis TaxID=1844116 RepID=UPI001115C068|nr:bifunctional precorrin-2 dehydrogenase/sirohydrochlorin ferrochelatase [Brevibacillus dissolubilis]
MPSHYPIMLELTGRACLVVGGGEVATRKIESLLHAGAYVTVITPEAQPAVIQWAQEGVIKLIQEPYTNQDVSDYTLVVAATNIPEVNLTVYEAVKAVGGWINIVDRPDLCNFIVPSTIQRGKLVISVSTSGASPSLARKLRKQLEEQFDEAYESYVDFLAEIRRQVLTDVVQPEVRRRIFRKLLDDTYVHATEEERYQMAAALIAGYQSGDGEQGRQ